MQTNKKSIERVMKMINDVQLPNSVHYNSEHKENG